MPTPAQLRPHYTHFLRHDRVLLTGHSHQAWPDVARDATLAAFDDAARSVDDKWSRAFEVADALRAFIAARLGTRAEQIALAPNTHELVARFLSALDLTTRRHLVTTAGEFHSIHRQLRRLAEAGVEVTFVDPLPAHTLSERLARALRDDTAAVLTSTVLFETATRVPHLEALLARAEHLGAQVLLDAYHAFQVVPFSLESLAPRRAFLVGGGYKYAQWGEGNCFMCVPEECALRPVHTGWFADFSHLADPRTPASIHAPVAYASQGAWRFAGSTYDPTSHYRALAVARFFEEQSLTVPALHAISRAQTERIVAALGDWPIATPRDPDARGGFVSVPVRDTSRVVETLRAQHVWVDARGPYVRLGPAPYLTDDEIDRGVMALRACAQPLAA